MGLGNRKGMSPLIATVQLMAFAVALGGMIMNWSIDRNNNNDCNRINVHVTKFCSTTKGIDLAMQNDKESLPIQEIKVSYMQEGFESIQRIPNSKLLPGQVLSEIVIPTLVPAGTVVSIFGILGDEQKPIACTAPLQRADPLQAC
jgi:flagellin-like protein